MYLRDIFNGSCISPNSVEFLCDRRLVFHDLPLMILEYGDTDEDFFDRSMDAVAA